MSAKLKIIDFVRNELSKSNIGAHTFDHTMRVYSLAVQLSEKLPVNRSVLEAATLLHDVGRPREAASDVSHSIISGEMSREFLSELGFSEADIEGVVTAIRTHRFSERIEPTSLEGQILSDADKLDAIGAIGVYRAIAQATSSGRGIHGFLKHSDEKLLKLKELLYTDPARQMAIQRHEALYRFVEQLRHELKDSRY